MGSQYQGDPDNYPEDYTIPDDADPPTATAVNVGLEALGDRTECIRTQGLMTLNCAEYTGDGFWEKPDNLASQIVDVEFFGGGGGGGHGGVAGAGTFADTYISGGGAGGGALERRVSVDITDMNVGEEADVVVGPGGQGGQNPGDAGLDGTESSVSFPDVVQIIAQGASGGGPGITTEEADGFALAVGGPPIALAQTTGQLDFGAGITKMVPALQPSQGGHSKTSNAPFTGYMGAPSPCGVGALGGQAALKGADDGSYRGGGGAGGGGGGPNGIGADGGAGGDGNNAGAGTAGANGSNAAANSGAGGGGGGAGGYGSASHGAHGKGGNGGSGRVRIYYWTKGRVLP